MLHCYGLLLVVYMNVYHISVRALYLRCLGAIIAVDKRGSVA